ncbi:MULTISPECIES: hypothetical protein [Candidatus Hamiltonella]|uniref:hypothetical protein n=1 Tax=Candidatus Williamhamiltonella TaxID=568987 RepID=UPI0015C56B37|nr:hypothetical protein [Candidatus Hamiltonella defensa]
MRTELCVAKWRIGVESPIGGSFTTQIEAVSTPVANTGNICRSWGYAGKPQWKRPVLG